MSEEIKPVQTVPDAGAEQTPAEAVAEETQTTETEPSAIAEAIALAEASDKELANAETKIVSLKRKLKGVRDGEVDVEDQQAKIAEEVARQLAEREAIQPIEEDVELKAIQAQRKRNAEIIVALKAKHSLSNSGGGSNQDKLKPKVDPSKMLSDEQKEVYQKVAERRGLPLETILAYKAEADKEGKTVVQYMLDRKIK